MKMPYIIMNRGKPWFMGFICVLLVAFAFYPASAIWFRLIIGIMPWFQVMEAAFIAGVAGSWSIWALLWVSELIYSRIEASLYPAYLQTFMRK